MVDGVLIVRIPICIEPVRVDSAPTPSLTRREKEVLGFVVEGMSNKEVGAKVFLSERTVKFHVSSLLEKYHVSSRGELANKVRKTGAL